MLEADSVLPWMLEEDETILQKIRSERKNKK
jgi:hypothetical protein